MLTNDQMKQNRYGRWAQARKLYNRIHSTLAAGGIVTIGTMTRYTHYDKRHIDMFKCNRFGVYVQRGKSWDCIDYCGFRFTL